MSDMTVNTLRSPLEPQMQYDFFKKYFEKKMRCYTMVNIFLYQTILRPVAGVTVSSGRELRSEPYKTH